MTINPLAYARGSESLPSRDRQGAVEFEAMLLQQMLQSAHESEEQDSTADAMWSLAAQQFAKVLAGGGGVGIAKLIEQSLK